MAIVGQRAYEDTQMEWARFEIVVSSEAHRDGNGIGEIKPSHRECKHGIDGLGASESQQAKENSQDSIEPYCVHRRLRVAIDAIQPARERKGFRVVGYTSTRMNI